MLLRASIGLLHHCEERKRRSNPCLRKWRDGLLPPSLVELRRTSRFARNDAWEAGRPSLPRRDDDEAISLAADLPFPVSNDVNEIADFLKADKDQVIFSTYQSSPLVAQAQKRPDVPHFDLVIADEAHRCAGKSDTVFGTVLDDRLIKSDRRLFATATPRVYRTSLKKAAEEFGVEVVDMNDEEQFRKTVSYPDVWRGHQTRATYRLSRVDRWRRQRARQGVDREPSTCRYRYRTCDRRQIAGGTNRTAESNQGLEPSQVDLLSWPREGSAYIFGRHRPSCPVAGRRA